MNSPERHPNRTLYVLGLAILGAAVLVGCGPDQGSGATAPAEPSDAAADTDQAALPEPTEEDRAAELDRREQEIEQREAALASEPATRAAEPARTPLQPRTYPRPASGPSNAAAGEMAVVNDTPRSEELFVTRTLTLPQATALDVEFLDGLSSETNVEGDRFQARVTGNITQDGVVVVPAGSRVSGVVAEATAAKKIGGQAGLTLAFDQIEFPSGERMPMTATLIEQGKRQTGRDAATIGGAAAGGAVLGRVLSKHDKSKKTAIGAIAGAAIGTAIAAKNANDPVLIEPGMTASLTLEAPLAVAVRMPVSGSAYAEQR